MIPTSIVEDNMLMEDYEELTSVLIQDDLIRVNK